MQINYTTNAFETLIQLVNYIETTNTEGGGMRWLNRYEAFLQKKFLYPEHIKLCLNSAFSKLNLRCVYFNDWLIAFSVHENFILVETILHKSRISD